MTTLADYLNDFALDIIHNVVEFKDSKDGAIEYDEDGLEDLKQEFLQNIKDRLIGD